ncbi:MAG: hypothetical protein DI552_04820 [Brevundimonas sp.]|uniref:DUF883 domain-containing protein n=1 Tax=Brevundimonas albigilva TaxID=1312364 RepID=A0ABY4SR41_9CAUL|nr:MULTISPECIES: hypothetical protein [Brevundimonas]MCV0413543.1 hypothetical protein [Brevundimonas sp.]PZU60345.1 MAG: hypothetical protein DI552_04820 [Brevundimonas sp.]UQV18593.1 hypothetical protein MU852_01275 [Brevundimonas albigilva]URI16635.1 hypothetical protein M8231_06585 [Brevundimonas albigilva]
MTQTPIAPASPDDIVLEDDSLTHRLDVAADEMIAAGERRSFDRPDSLRGAVKADAARLREGVEDGVVQARERIRQSPERATLYALGIGVILGMLLRR